MKRSIEKNEAEIEEISQKWKQLLHQKEKHMKRMEEDIEEVKKLKREIKDNESRIQRDNVQVNKIVQEFAILQAQVTDKQNWIDKCKTLYP